MVSLRVVQTILSKEVRDVRRNRWFLLVTLIFTGLALLLSLVGLSGLGAFGIAGFGRTAASLLNLALLIVPLMGLLLGALSVVNERENGTLLILMAQPISPTELLLGKFLGLSLALAAALLLGFGVSGLVIAYYAGSTQLTAYLSLCALTLLLGWAFLSLGFCLSVMMRRVATALGLTLLLWLTVVLLSDLGLMGTVIALQLGPEPLLWLSLLNPAQAFRLTAVYLMQGNLELLGPAGIYAIETLGKGLMPTLTILLVAWIALPLSLAIALFRRRGMV